MIKYVLIIGIGLISSRSDCQNNIKLWNSTQPKLWYKKPAEAWTEALPIGNGRLGAMVFGKVQHELIQLNESSLWTGGPVHTHVNPDAYANLILARDALLNNENYSAAYEYAKKMQGYYSESYLPLGDLSITQEFKDSTPAEYYRDLNIRDAISTTRFKIDGTVFTRQVIISAPDQVIAIHLTASKKGRLNFTVGFSNQLRSRNSVPGANEMEVVGRAPAHIEPNYIQSDHPIVWEDSAGCRGMRYDLLIKAISQDGSVTTDTGGIKVRNASDVTIYISAATSFNGFDKCPFSDGRDEKMLAAGYMNPASVRSWEDLLQIHYQDYHKYFERVFFSLKAPADESHKSLPTDERLSLYTKGVKDPDLETLYFQYSRYLLISGSRTPGVPANLQGIWNKELRPPWSSNYTTNINVEMNYWPAEETNLSEMHQPFLDFISNASVTGRVTAREFYHTRGWAVHHNSDIWALSNPVGDLGHGDPMWANWTMGSPWLSQHLWWHYQFTMDKNYLSQTAYPLMKGAAQFCMDWLVPYKNYLVTAPSFSPENSFIDDKGEKESISIATTMDMAIIRDLFSNTILAADELGIDSVFRDSLIAKRKLLYPLQIGKKGNLQEWYKDWEDTDPHHRHVSHLFTLFPGHDISVIETPALAAAARKTLELRGDAGTGWSLAWKINFWAMLQDGNHAYKMLRDILSLTNSTSTNYSGGGGSYINLFDAHPPFQIDGNFGALSGMVEMLLQSQAKEIYLLPALPDAWAEGKISGLKARGNFEISMRWRNKKLTSADILSVNGGKCILRTSEPIKIRGLHTDSKKTTSGYVTEFNTEKDKDYYITVVKRRL